MYLNDTMLEYAELRKRIFDLPATTELAYRDSDNERKAKISPGVIIGVFAIEVVNWST